MIFRSKTISGKDKERDEKSMKHWCVTEKGHTNTRRIHLHGIFYAPNGMTQFKLINILRNNWIDGYCYNGKYCNEKTINYVSKYMTKRDEDNPEYTGKVLCSPGLGAGYIKRIGKRHDWKGEETKEDYYTRQGTLIALPKYYKYNYRDHHPNQQQQNFANSDHETIR